MHSLPQDRVGVPYVHDDCHNLYRPVKQSDVKSPSGSLQVGCCAGPAHLLRFWIRRDSCSRASLRAELNRSCHFFKNTTKTLCIKLEGLKV